MLRLCNAGPDLISVFIDGLVTGVGPKERMVQFDFRFPYCIVMYTSELVYVSSIVLNARREKADIQHRPLDD